MSGKRAKGEGSVHRLPSGNWQSQIMDGYTDEGKRHIVSFTAPSRAEALSKLREYLLNKEESAAPEVPLFEDYAQRWYEAYRSQVEESTYLVSLMAQCGLLGSVATTSPAETADLAQLARNYKQTLFDIHPKWAKSTVKGYSYQYDKLVEEMAGLRTGDLDETAYRQLQEKICHSAAKDATKSQAWTYGETPPSSARTRLSLHSLIKIPTHPPGRQRVRDFRISVFTR